MKLTDLNPIWIGSGGEGVFDKDHNPMPRREGMGIEFDCPICGDKHPCFVPFENPLDGGSPIGYSHHWKRVGNTFENLTLTPSILRMDGCKWHGFVTKGEIIFC
jgi:hypothetical protein